MNSLKNKLLFTLIPNRKFSNLRTYFLLSVAVKDVREKNCYYDEQDIVRTSNNIRAEISRVFSGLISNLIFN